VVQLKIKFASLKEQSLFYGDIPDDDPIDYHDVEEDKEGLGRLAEAIEDFVPSAGQAGMSRDGVQNLQKLVTSRRLCSDSRWAQKLRRM
jgi:hypothetical protein